MRHEPQVVLDELRSRGGIAAAQAVEAVPLLGGGERAGEGARARDVQDQKEKARERAGEKSGQHRQYLRQIFGRSPVIRLSYAEPGLFVARPSDETALPRHVSTQIPTAKGPPERQLRRSFSFL